MAPDAPLERLATGVLTCSLCSKLFDQETSHARHVQYCRRRHQQRQANSARGGPSLPPARQRACDACRWVKSKCDFGKPCARCVSKNVECLYGQGSGVGGAQKAALGMSEDSAGTALVVVSQDAGFENFLGMDFDLATPSWPDAGPSWLNSGESAQPTVNTLDFGATDFLPWQLPTPVPFIDLDETGDDSLSLVPVPPNSAEAGTTMVPRRRPGLISDGIRRFIISVLRTYPRMMAQTNNLPPFIHPFGQGLHYDRSPEHNAADADGTASPLRPLVACRGVTRLFMSLRKDPTSDPFLWRTVDTEQRQIREEMGQYSRGETLAAFQAMIIYTIMRLVHSGHEYFLGDRSMIQTMNKLAERMSNLHPGPLSPAHTWNRHIRWEDWVYDETRRRITVTCFLMALIVGSDGSAALRDPSSLTLPSCKAVWEASTRRAWESAYAYSLRQLGLVNDDEIYGQHTPVTMSDGQRLLCTLGDLAAAQHGLGGGVFDEDLVDGWLSGVDGLGMVLAAVLGGC